ncbi:MAG: ATP-dependent DNA helicase [Opitutales bacterium]
MIHLREALDGAMPPDLLARQTEAVFQDGGFLQRALGLEHRPQQARMAVRVAEAFEQNAPLLFEAGTGVGKSLAYLVPGLLRALSDERPLLVSTHTKALQEQVRAKDLELCRALFRQTPQLADKANFRVAKLVGRANYCCTTRLARALAAKAELFPTEQENELARIAEWATQTTEGLVEELSPPPSREVWEWVNADSSVCNRKNCADDECFYRKALKQRDLAHVIILNHSLLFALLAAGMTPPQKTPGVLLANDFAVLDEAHRIAEVATEYFGHELSDFGLNRLLRQLHNPKRKKGRGLLAKIGRPQDRQAVETLAAASERFFDQVQGQILRRREIVRLEDPDWAEPTFLKPMDALLQCLGACLTRLDEPNQRDELNDLRQRLAGFRAGLLECLSLGQEDTVYWAERAGRKQSIIKLRSAPLDVGPYLRRYLFQRETSVVLTSATLSCGDDMKQFRRRNGAEHIDGEQVASPFDYETQTKVYLATDAPQPGQSDSRLDAGYLAEMIAWFAQRTEGGTLVLFTSYADLGRVERLLGSEFDLGDRPLLAQGRDLGRDQLLATFRQAGNAVLLGTETFWTGVDVPGVALSQVIVTRLPFENPSHPVAQARSEKLRGEGRNPFQEMTLPDAILQFRQGIGRLIRSSTDEGRVVILDSRLVQRPYGRAFLEVLPGPAPVRFDRGNRSERVPARK